MANQDEAEIRLKVKFELEDCERGKLLRIAETGQVLLLNESASQILRGLKMGQSRTQLIEGLTSSFGAEPNLARHDVERCLHELLQLGMLEDARF